MLYRKQNIPQLTQALNDLYVIRRNQYLKQVDGNTYTVKAGKEITTKTGAKYKQRPLVDTMLTEHLNGKATYGVFASYDTKFIVFDLDFEDDWQACKWHYYKVRNAIIETGVSEGNIYTVFSGNKGLHVTLYFDTAIPVKVAQRYYAYVLEIAELTDKKNVIEFRPTNKQGVKLPLGLHHKTKKRVTFVDNMDVEKTLPSTHILAVNKINTDEFTLIMDELDDTYGHDTVATTELTAQEVLKQADEQLFSRTKLLQVYGLGTDEDYTVEYYNRLLTEGLKAQGTRHKITYQLALYLKTSYGMDREQALDTLLEWLHSQPKNTYTTPLEDAILDTREIVADIYDNNRVLNLTQKELTVTVKELHTVLTATKANGKAFTPKQKTVLFALLMHAKRYANKAGTFFMTYTQLKEATGYANRSRAKALIEEFTELGLIAIHRTNTRQEGTYKHLPNVYSVPFAVINKNTATNSTANANDNGVSTVTSYNADTFTGLVRERYTAKQLRKLLPKDQAKRFTA